MCIYSIYPVPSANTRHRAWVGSGNDYIGYHLGYIRYKIYRIYRIYNLCIVRTSFGGDSYRVFCLGSLGSFSHGTLPDYLHRLCIFRRGQLARFFFWVPWEVCHTVLCLIIYIVRTSFGGESYRVFFSSGFPEKFFTRYSA